jgi:hypothetical protein
MHSARVLSEISSPESFVAIAAKVCPRMSGKQSSAQIFNYAGIEVKAGPKTTDREIECLVCGAPLAARDDEFVLKYFLLRTANRRRPHHASRPE